ncbi:MAG: AraC family transcriptional regulator [Aquabacterium sp.]|uniref:helix-turn-helix domain-containing protein n=1 Tax=Aquabacterium sp. TaxID=1872578 RepID=UPI00271B1815|nr:AraC family transcriptional regulator [Aquabacterium sp.]MDO9002414.1 AraC family transcriptional regulator [Aquabacterium sp.]
MRGDTGLSKVNHMRSIALLDVKVSTGCTPYQWLLVRKIDKAKLLLKGPLPIAAISAECGFADQAHLTRVFNMAVGTTPGRWRAEHRQRP